ncbi:hypothetical protein [Litoribacter populi]|uniref:hypothetical protein n=1 Tax=Litoribacter populi TaxID=2598460 RepID=UPI00163DC827|nr:hypothetical protein [Litoribacter populi]
MHQIEKKGRPENDHEDVQGGKSGYYQRTGVLSQSRAQKKNRPVVTAKTTNTASDTFRNKESTMSSRIGKNARTNNIAGLGKLN